MKSLTKVHLKVLRYLDQNGKSRADKLANSLGIPYKEINTLLEDFYSRPEGYIQILRYIKEGDKSIPIYSIRAEGIDYLQRLESQHSSKQQLKFNKVIALTGSIIAFVTLWNFFDKFLNSYFGRKTNQIVLISFIIMVIIVLFLFFLLGRETTMLYTKD